MYIKGEKVLLNESNYLMESGDDMCVKDELNLILKEAAKTYMNIYGDNLVDIFLYGSYARGDYDEYNRLKEILPYYHNILKEGVRISA